MAESAVIIGQTLTSAELMSRDTGRSITDMQHLQQSIIDILTTPIGSRVMRRDYGSRIFQLMDRPADRALIPLLQATVLSALNQWEPRIRISKVNLQVSNWPNGELSLNLEGFYLIAGRPIRLQDLSVDFFMSRAFAPVSSLDTQT